MRINIIIPNYNKEAFVVKCVESCVKQNYGDFKVIFIDNESTDNSLELVRKFRKESGYDFIIDTAPNIYPRCWNECTTQAAQYLDGDYYTIVGSDDYLDENYLLNFYNWAKTKNDIHIAQSCLLWTQNNQVTKHTGYVYSSIDELKRGLLTSCTVHTPTVFYSDQIYREISWEVPPTTRFASRIDLYSGAGDYDLYFQFLDEGIFIHPIGEWIGYYYNVNEGQATWDMHKDPINYDALIINKWRAKWNM